MPIGDLDVPVIGKNVVIAILVQSHILIATFILGASLIAPLPNTWGWSPCTHRTGGFLAWVP
jgi:hypothetical protein